MYGSADATGGLRSLGLEACTFAGMTLLMSGTVARICRTMSAMVVFLNSAMLISACRKSS